MRCVQASPDLMRVAERMARLWGMPIREVLDLAISELAQTESMPTGVVHKIPNGKRPPMLDLVEQVFLPPGRTCNKTVSARVQRDVVRAIILANGDRISLSQLAARTRMSGATAWRAMTLLRARKLVVCHDSNRDGSVYSVDGEMLEQFLQRPIRARKGSRRAN